MECDIIVTVDSLNSSITVDADSNVDEDPDEEKYGKEAGHRSFILGIENLGVYLYFPPPFLSYRLIREEMSEGTIHYMLAKPIARGELLLYRNAKVHRNHLAVHNFNLRHFMFNHRFHGPGDGFFRWSDIGVWMSIAWATMLVSLFTVPYFAGLE